MAGLTRFIEQRLRLKVNEEKSVVDRPENVHILGFSLRRNVEEKTTDVFLSIRTIVRLRQRIRELTPRKWGQSLDLLFDQANEYLEGWAGYFSLCTEAGARYFKNADAHIRRRIRCLILSRFRCQRFLFRHLVQRGAKEKAAAILSYSARGPWQKSIWRGANTAYPNKWFLGRLVNLESK